MKIKHAESKEFSLRKGKNKKISNKKSPARKLMNFFIFIFTAAVLGYGLVTFCFQTVTMLGPSMEPAVSDGDVLIINKMVYVFSDVKRNDIVAIKRMEKDKYFDVKRVVALPGDEVSIQSGKLMVNGKLASDEFISVNGDILNKGILSETITLGKDEYFVIGDNTSSSDDSRFKSYGMVQKTDIRGKVICKIKDK